MSENHPGPEERAQVAYFIHEGVVEHMNRCNRRMLTALLTVCLTFVVTIVIFVVGYTIRNRDWIECVEHLQDRPAQTQADSR